MATIESTSRALGSLFSEACNLNVLIADFDRKARDAHPDERYCYIMLAANARALRTSVFHSIDRIIWGDC